MQVMAYIGRWDHAFGMRARKMASRVSFQQKVVLYSLALFRFTSRSGNRYHASSTMYEVLEAEYRTRICNVNVPVAVKNQALAILDTLVVARKRKK